MSMTVALTLEEGMTHLAAIVGNAYVSVRHDTGQAIAVSPADAQQVAAVLQFAHANRLATVPTCGGTKLEWGNPVVPHIELCMKRLDEVREHAWQDMTCTVQAGCTWAAMQDRLRAHGQMVALDPLWPSHASVGGIVATNDSGALRLKYGSLRDLIIGMTVVLADGTIARSGGKVVKNVAGYDIHKLITGSFGTLGVIAEVNFRLHPLEEHARTWTASLPEGPTLPERFQEPLRELMNSQIVPSSVQMRVSERECAMDVRVAGLPECLEEYGARMQSIFGGFTVSDSTPDVWSARQRLFDEPDALIVKVSVLPDEVCPVGAELLQWRTGSSAVNIVAQATGLMTVAAGGSSEAAPAFVDRVRERVNPSGGSVVVLRAPAALKGNMDVWGTDGETVPLMREIKRNFDSHRILNPGRFVGGI